MHFTQGRAQRAACRFVSKIIKMKIHGIDVDIHTDKAGKARVHSQLRQTCGCCGKYVCEKRVDKQLIRYNEMMVSVEHLIASHVELGGTVTKQYVEAIEDMVSNCAKVAYSK